MLVHNNTSYLHIGDALPISSKCTDQRWRCGAMLADEHFTDGKMQLWRRATMFLEDASSLDRGFTFSTICQGYLRDWAKQWGSHSYGDSGRGPTLGSGTQTISLIQNFSVYLNVLSRGSVGTVFGRALSSHFSLLFVSFINVIIKSLWAYREARAGNTGPSVSCYVPAAFFHILHAVWSPEGGFDERAQGSDGQLGILWEFLKCCWLPVFLLQTACRFLQLWLNNAVSGLWSTCLLQLIGNTNFSSLLWRLHSLHNADVHWGKSWENLVGRTLHINVQCQGSDAAPQIVWIFSLKVHSVLASFAEMTICS